MAHQCDLYALGLPMPDPLAPRKLTFEEKLARVPLDKLTHTWYVI